MIEFPILEDRSIEDLLREVIGTNVPANGDGFPSKCFYFLNDKLRFLFVQAAEVDLSVGFHDRGKEVNILADYNLRTLFGEDDGSAPSNSLSQTDESVCTRNVQEGIQPT